MSITNFAQEVFRSDADQILVPRQKFNFTLIVNTTYQGNVLFHQVSDVSAPSFSVDGVLMNQYNKKRFVQTRLNYDPISIRFYDTFDNRWHDILRRYLAFYYNNGNGIEKRTVLEGINTVADSFVTDEGFTPNPIRNFFPEIKIVQNGYRNQYRETILINPFITGIQGDTLDYRSSDPVMYTVTFQPETIHVHDVSEQFDDGIGDPSGNSSIE